MVTAFVAGLIRTSALVFGTATQTAPPPAATLMCSEQHAPWRPTGIVATSLFVDGSMRETLGPPAFTTQTAPCETPTPSGSAPTLIVAVTAFVRGSIRKTVSSDGRDTQTAPLPTAASPQLRGNGGQGLRL